MAETVLTFFYGGLMNANVMARVGLAPREQAVASISGYRIHIEPWVTLVREPRSTSFGVLMTTSHQELASVYSKLAIEYFPHPVIAQTERGLLPALTYLAGPMESKEADPAHVAPLLDSARQLAFPAWYIDEIRSFLPAR